MIRTRILVASALALATTAPAMTARGDGIEDWFSAPNTSSLTAARHGGRIAFVLNRRGVRNIYVADAPAYQPRQVTRYDRDDGRAITSLTLGPDGKRAVFVYGNEPGADGNVNPTADVVARTQEVRAIELDTGTSAKLADGVEGRCGDPGGCTNLAVSSDGVHVAIAGRRGLFIAELGSGKPAVALAIRGSAAAPAWSPDGKSVAFTLYRNDHAMIAVYRLGEPSVRYLAPAFDFDDAARWSPDGKRIAFLRASYPPDGAPLLPQPTVPWSIWVADVATSKATDATWGAARAVWRSGADDSLSDRSPPGGFGFGAGSLLYFTSERDGWQHLYAIDLARPGGAPRLLTPGDFEVEDVVATADGSALIYSSNQGDLERRHLWRVALAGGAPRALTAGKGVESAPVITAQGAIFCLAATATQPAMVTAVGAKGLAAPITAGEAPASFPARSFVTPSTLVYRSDDGTPIHAQLLVPPGTGRHPAVMFLHGGPVRQLFPAFHPMGYYQDAYAMMQYLASRGFVVLAINYRGGVGYGRAFREAKGLGVRGASEYQDVRAAGAYLRGLPSVDPARVALWGGSYGGYLTALGLARNSDQFAAGVDYAGVTDWWELLGNESSRAPDVDEARKVAAATSPLVALDRWRSPVLVVHGDDDLNVDVSQSIKLVRGLERRGVRVEQMLLPDQTHFMTPWGSWIRTYRATAGFLERELRPAR